MASSEYRNIEKTRINNRLREIQAAVTDVTNTIGKYKTQQINREYFDTQVSKLNYQLGELEQEHVNLTDRLSLVNSGQLDIELHDEVKSTSIKVHRKEKVTKETKAKQDNLMKQRPSSDGSFGKRLPDPDRTSYVNYSKEYAYFQKICESVPDYMLKNLESMPNNKGYTWRGCWCFGDNASEQGEPTLVFEKQRQEDLMIIHEITDSSYNLYHKYGKDRKQLVMSTPKRKK